jgi:hypothetical protein
MANKTQRIQIGTYWLYKKKIRQQPIFINGTQVPYANTAKYLVMSLEPSYGKRTYSEKKHDVLKIKLGKRIGCLDAILSYQSKINSYYRNKFYIQFGVMVYSFGAPSVN